MALGRTTKLAVAWIGGTQDQLDPNGTVPPEDLFRAIRGTARGETVLAPAVAARLVRRSGPMLTEREVEILGLLATGKSNRDLAKKLYVSEATIKSHLAHIYSKLDVDTRAAAVARAIEQRIIRPVS